jgi:hypothetical protein
VDTDDAGDVHDRARPALHHPAGRSAAGVEDAAEVGRDDVVPVLVRHPRNHAVTGKAGVVDKDVQVAGLRDEVLRLLDIGDVGLDGTRTRFARDFLGLILAGAKAERDVGACARELERDRAADST